MLMFAAAEESLKVEKALDHIEPLLADLERELGLPIKEEILSSLKNGGANEVQRRIRRLIYMDILVSLARMRSAEEMSIFELKRSLKIVYLKLESTERRFDQFYDFALITCELV